MDEREYRRNRSGKKKKSEGPISRYKRKMRGSIDDPYCEAGMRVDPELFAQRDKERFNRFGDDSELEAILSAKSSTVTEGENLTPQQEAQINSVFQAGIPVAIVGSYGTALGTKTIWQTFGKVVAKRFGAVAAQALGLSVGDGILPVGDAIALGLLAVTAWQIARNWDELWRDVEQILVATEPEPQIYTTPNGETGTVEHTGSVPPDVETGTPEFDITSATRTPEHTGHGQREQPNARDFVMEWKPSMTPAEADEYTRDSYYAGKTFYHGTDVLSGQNISESGVDPAFFNELSNYGTGFYTAKNQDGAREYAELKAEETGEQQALLGVKLKANNPIIFSSGVDFSVYADNYVKERGLTYVEPPDAYGEYLQSQGYDAIEIEALGYVVVFEPEQVVVIGTEVIK